MKPVRTAGIIAGILILAGLPVLYFVQPIFFKKGKEHFERAQAQRYGQPAKDYFAGQLKKLAHGNSTYKGRATVPRRQVRKLFKKHGAGLEQVAPKPWEYDIADDFFWERPFVRKVVRVAYYGTEEDPFYVVPGSKYDWGVFNIRAPTYEKTYSTGLLILIWTATLVVLVLRLRASLKETGTGLGRLIFFTPKTKNLPHRYERIVERMFPRLRVGALILFALAVISLGWYAYSSLQSSRCKTVRGKIYNLQSHYKAFNTVYPRAEDLIGNFQEYRKHYLERISESCMRDGRVDAACVESRSAFPESAEELVCPSGGRIYSGNNPREIKCSVHTND